MSRTSQCPLVGKALAGLAALAFCAGLAPAPVQASCGEGVLSGHSEHLGPNHGPMPHAPLAQDHPADAPRSRKPCDGPGCSRAPLLPPLTSPAPTPPAVDDAGLLPFTPDPGRAPCLSQRQRGPSGRPIPHRSDVFHPPR